MATQKGKLEVMTTTTYLQPIPLTADDDVYGFLRSFSTSSSPAISATSKNAVLDSWSSRNDVCLGPYSIKGPNASSGILSNVPADYLKDESLLWERASWTLSRKPSPPSEIGTSLTSIWSLNLFYKTIWMVLAALFALRVSLNLSMQISTFLKLRSLFSAYCITR